MPPPICGALMLLLNRGDIPPLRIGELIPPLIVPRGALAAPLDHGLIEREAPPVVIERV